MKTLLFTSLALIGSSLMAAGNPADSSLSAVSLDTTSDKVTVTVQSKTPLTLSVHPVTYNRKPEYWLHEIGSVENPLAGACAKTCSQSVTFAVTKMGFDGIEIQYENKNVKLGFKALAK